MRILRTTGVALALLVCAVQIKAQDTTGKITGTVTDPSGGTVPDAKVTVTNNATGIGHTTTTDQSGTYQVLQLPIGLYRVTAEAPGFKAITVNSTTPLDINQTLRIDIKAGDWASQQCNRGSKQHVHGRNGKPDACFHRDRSGHL